MRARILNAKGDLIFAGGRAQEALSVYQQARTNGEESLRAEPESIYHRSTLIRSWTGLWRAALACGERERARTALRSAIDVGKPFASKYPAECYEMACRYALLIPLSAPAERDSLGAAAVETLREAIAVGFHDHAHMGKDTDLDSIRDRADFKELLSSAR